MKIAVIGSGITGLGAAYALCGEHDVKLFEKNNRFGGHSNTVDVDFHGKTISVDTGFIVYNNLNYPNLSGLFDELNVSTKWSDMSFGFSQNGGQIEYACDSLDKLFSQRKNIFNLKFISGLLEILRFNRQAPIALENGDLQNISFGDYLLNQKHGTWFTENFILPMGSAIWSTPAAQVLNFPALSFISFFKNHDLLVGMSKSQRWRTVEGGSRVYVNQILKKLGSSAKKNCGIRSVERISKGVNLTFSDGNSEIFDQVIFCTHAPETMEMLVGKSDEEHSLLGSFKTSNNRVILHSDHKLMPRRKKVWSSWNFISTQEKGTKYSEDSVTYWMNRLQGIDKKCPLFVSLNPIQEPESKKFLKNLIIIIQFLMKRVLIRKIALTEFRAQVEFGMLELGSVMVFTKMD
jgi:predicted NAD/FAD-binding protein